jgi:hypothetical protein
VSALLHSVAFWVVMGIILAIACILMPLADRPAPPRRSSVARPIPHPIPRAPSASSSRPTAPPSPPGPVPVALGEHPAEVVHA